MRFEGLTIRPRSGAFDVERIRAHLSECDYAVLDPVEGRLHLIDVPGDILASTVRRRVETRKFSAHTVFLVEAEKIEIVDFWPNTISYCQSFIQWLIDRYDCTIVDDRDNDLTDEVGKDASILFPPRPPPKERPRPPLADRPDTSPADAPQLMAAEVASGRATERRAGDTIIWEYADGTVVRFRPHGDDYHPKPFFTIEVKRDTEAPYSGPDSAAFRVDAQGRPVPRNGREIAVPSDLSGPIERRIFIQYLLRTGERELGS